VPLLYLVNLFDSHIWLCCVYFSLYVLSVEYDSEVSDVRCAHEYLKTRRISRLMPLTFVLIFNQEWPSRDGSSLILVDRTIINPTSFLPSIDLSLYSALRGWWEIIFSMEHIHKWDQTPAISLTDIDSYESFYWWYQSLGEANLCLWLYHWVWCLFDFLVLRIHCMPDAHALLHTCAKGSYRSNRIKWTISHKSNTIIFLFDQKTGW
jgi:hypothetical protein